MNLYKFTNLYKLTKNNLFSYLYWVLLLLVTITFHHNNPLNSDEGVILAGAWNLINNKKLYIDFFEFIPPGSYYLVAFAWKFFGTSYFTAKVLSAVMLFFSAVGIYKIVTQIQQHYLNYFPPLMFILSSFYWPLINHNFFNIFLIIWAIFYLVSGISEEGKNARSNIYLMVSGFFTSLAIIFLHSRGLVFCGANVFFILLVSIKSHYFLFIKKAGVYLLASLTPLLTLFLVWPPNLLYSSLISFPLNNYIEVNKIPFTLLFITVGNIFLIGLSFGRFTDKRLRYLFYIQLVLLFSTISRPDLFHISIILFPSYILLSIKNNVNVINITPYFKFKTSFIMPSLLISISISILYIAPSLFYSYQIRPFFVDRSIQIVSEIKEFCDDSSYIYAGPFAPGIYFESRKLNPSKYSYVITNMYPEHVFVDVKNSMLTYQPSCAILFYDIVDKFNYNKDNIVDNFIYENFIEIIKGSGYSIYRKVN